MPERPLSDATKADRALCPVAVSQVLGLRVHDVAEAMRKAGATASLTLGQARAWRRLQSDVPDWLLPLFAEAAARTARREADRARRAVEDEHRMLLLEDRVIRRLVTGGRVKGADAEFIAADLAARAVKELVRSDGDTDMLLPLDLAGLTWAGVDPSDRRTWFLQAGSGSGQV